MENENMNDITPVPYYFHEKVVDSLERINKRLWIALILVVVMLVATNGAWIWYESQFQDEVVTVEATTDAGGPAIANASGEVTFNGESQSDGTASNP